MVKQVSDESEAEIVCGLLRSAGIECGYRDTEAIDSPLEDFTSADTVRRRIENISSVKSPFAKPQTLRALMSSAQFGSGGERA